MDLDDGFVLDEEEEAGDGRVAHLTEETHVVLDLTAVTGMVAARLVVDDDGGALRGDDDAVGALLMSLVIHDGELVEDLKTGLEPGSDCGQLEYAGDGLLHLRLVNHLLIDDATRVEVVDDLGRVVGSAYLLHDGVDVVAFLLGSDVGLRWVVEDG